MLAYPVKPTYAVTDTQVYCVIDYETRSEAPFGKSKENVGAYEYANHPSTRLLNVGWRIGTFDQLKNKKTKTVVWSPLDPLTKLIPFLRALDDPRILLVAHNAFFEQVITEFVLPRLTKTTRKLIPVSRWICTASMARALALPGALGDACDAIRLEIQKDKKGHALMLRMSKPKPAWKKWAKSGRIGPEPKKWNAKVSDMLRLCEYNEVDVDAEVGLFTTIKPLAPLERKIWELDQKINKRGFLCDRPLVGKILKMVGQEMKRFDREITELTDGRVKTTNQRDQIKAWLSENGLSLPNLQKLTVANALDSGLAEGACREVLTLRQDAAKSSTGKYGAFWRRSVTDGRMRDNLVYHRASTGRWGGSGVQPQNFPDPKKIGDYGDLDLIAQIIKDPDVGIEDLRHFGNPLDLFAALLRTMIIASEGKELFDGDFAGIEVRVLFWLANHTRGLDAFRSGRDLYVELASVIYKRTCTKADKTERDLGKRAVLGCGFGMGDKKFLTTCHDNDLEIDAATAKTAVKAYREVHAPVVRLWSNYEKAAMAAVRNPSKRFTVNRITWFMEGKFLFARLPSGRHLAYYGPEIRDKKMPWGEIKPALFHWDIHPKSGKWFFTDSYGGKLVENCVQAVARDLMAGSMVRLEDAGFEVVLSVHDELLTEALKGARTLKEFLSIMGQGEPWSEGLPVLVEGWQNVRYRK